MTRAVNPGVGDYVQRLEMEAHLTSKPLQSLTPRERQVFDLLLLGLMNKQIAARIGLVEITVKYHRAAIFRKYGVRNAVQLVRKVHGLDADTNETVEGSSC